MLARRILFGLIVGIFVCNPQGVHSQFIRRVSRQGSVSKANTDVYGRTVDLGLLEFNRGVSNSRSVTKANGGFRNGGTTSISNSNALTGGVNVAGLPIGSTLTRTQSRNNGAVSRGVAHDLNVGNFGIGTSLSRDNLRNGFGLQRSQDGGLSLGLGLLNVGLTDNAQQNNQGLTQSQVQARGKNAKVHSSGNTITNNKQFGLIGVSETHANSNAVGRTRFGETSASTTGLTNGAATNAGTAYNRGRQNTVGFQNPLGLFSNGPFFFRRRRATPKRRPKRRAQFIPFAYPDEDLLRVRRQFGFGGFNNPGFGHFGGFGGFGGGFQPQRQNANSQGTANNKFNGFQQQAGTNSHSNNEFNEGGFFQDNGASGIGSNVADDGTRGQVSSANVAQMNSQTADGSKSTNNAQSQTLNFDPNMQQAASSNAGTEHIKDANSERIKATGGSQSTNNNQFGTSSNIANTNSGVVREGNSETVSSDASSQSIFQGANGGTSGAFTNSQTNSVNRPGFVSNSASSSSSATSNGGGPANANASAGSILDAGSGEFGSGGFGPGGFGPGGFGPGGFGPGGFGPGQFAPAAPGPQANNKRRKGNGNITFPVSYQSRLFTYHRQRQHQHQRQRQQLQQPRLFPLYVSTATSSILINHQNRSSTMIQSEQKQQQQPQQQQQFTMLRQQQQQQQSGTELRRARHMQEENSPTDGDMSINRTTEQFGTIDERQRQGRTFQFITNLINSLSPCVYPCTIDAFRNNRCCIAFPPPLPPPPSPPPPLCCYPPPRPLPPPPPPPPPPPMPIPIPRPPINCCVTCTSFGYYGPPPCYRYGFGFGFGATPLLGGLSNNVVGWARTASGTESASASAIATSASSAALQSRSGSVGTQVTIYVPRPSSLTSLYVSTRDM